MWAKDARRHATLVLFLAWLGPVGCAPMRQEPSPGATGGAFVERFRNFDGRFWYVSDGWSNSDWDSSSFSADQVVLTPEGLALAISPAEGGGKPYRSAEVQSRARYSYGYFEARFRALRGAGALSSFFTYTGPPGPAWDEIDIEILGRNTRELRVSYVSGGQRTRSVVVPLGFDASAEAHTYAFAWREDAIHWYVDGALAHSETGAQAPIPRLPQKIMFNNATSVSADDWRGATTLSDWPQAALYECIAYAPITPSRPLCLDAANAQ